MKFKVGDHIAMYQGSRRFVGRADYIAGDVVHMGIENQTKVVIGHYKQCRRLVPNKPLRRVWIHPDEVSYECPCRLPRKPDQSDSWIEFVEVRKKKS